jgi:hypothetical protein
VLADEQDMLLVLLEVPLGEQDSPPTAQEVLQREQDKAPVLQETIPARNVVSLD